MPSRVQLAIGVDIHDLASWEWTTMTDRFLSSTPTSTTRGLRAEGTQHRPPPGQVSVRLRNPDGHLTPDNPASPWWPHIAEGTPLRIQRLVDGAWRTRWTGQIDAVEPAEPWEGVSGTAEVTISASGVTQRLGQGNPALDPAIQRRIMAPPNQPFLRAFWPMTDGRDSTHAASPLPNVDPMLVAMQFAADDTIPSAGTIPHARGGQPWGFDARVPAGPGGSWSVDWICKIEEADVSRPIMIIDVAGGTPFSRWDIRVGPNLITVAAWVDNIQFGPGSTFSSEEFFRLPNYCRFQLIQEEDQVTFLFAHFPLDDAGFGFGQGETFTGQAGRPRRLRNLGTAPPEGITMGQLAVTQLAPLGWLAQAEVAFNGEAAAARWSRLLNEERVPHQVIGSTDRSPQMGPQRPLPLLDLLEECAAAGGAMSEMHTFPGMTYRTNESMHNQEPALVIPRRALINPLRPIKDTRQAANDVTASRPDGSRAHVEDLAHQATRGPYQDSIVRNVERDEQLPYHASWRLTQGTDPRMRTPAVTFALEDVPELADDLRALRIGDRVQVEAPSDTLPAVDLLALGVAEAHGEETWRPTLIGNPAHLWDAVTWAERGGSATALTPNARWDISDTGLDVPLTWCSWVRPDALPADFAGLFYTGSVSNSEFLAVFIHQATGRISVWDDSFTLRAETDVVTLDEWLFLAVTLDGAGDIGLYWRTEDTDDALSFDTGTFAGAALSDDFLYIGSNRNAPDFNHTFEGAYAYARVFEAVLDAAELLTESTNITAQHPAVWGDWPLNTTAGPDQSGNGNDLTLEEGTGSATLTDGPEGVANTGFGRWDTRHSILETGITDTDTTATIRSTTPGRPWVNTTDHPDELPVNIALGGEVATATAISQTTPTDPTPVPAAADTFTRTRFASWATSSSLDQWREEGALADTVRSVDGARGLLTLTGSMSFFRAQTIGPIVENGEVLVSMSVDQIAAGAPFFLGALFRYAGLQGNFYRARAHFNTDQTIDLSVTRGSSQIGSAASTGETCTPDDLFWLRAQCEDHTVRARLWADGDPEPGTWTVEETITDSDGPINRGTLGLIGSTNGATNTDPTFAFDDLQAWQLHDAVTQDFTLTRSVNGIVKAHPADTEIHPAHPIRWASPGRHNASS